MGKAILIENKDRIILFDGVCNLCNGFVQFIIKRDKLYIFRFASLQSDFAKGLLEQHPQLKKVDAVIFLNKDQIFIKSDAAIEIAQNLKGWKWMKYLYIFPKPLRDLVYDLIAKYRYKLFGKKDTCMIPAKSIKNRFVS